MDYLIWTGAVVSLLGLVGIIWCILTVARARRQGLPDPELRAVIQRVMPRNLAALFLSVIGLMMVVVGILLN